MACRIAPKRHIDYDLPDLMHSLSSSGDSAVRALAAIDLGEAGDKSAVPALLAALCDPARKVRASAAEALGVLGDAKAVPALLCVLRDVDEDVRWAAALALQHLGPSAVPGLMEALRDANQAVRQAAAWALREVSSLQSLISPADWQMGS